MFCFQCEQTVGGKGCVRLGVCGKDTEVAALQDLLVFQMKGIAFYGHGLLGQKAEEITPSARAVVVDGLFSTLTNVDFDADRFVALLKEAQAVKETMRRKLGKVSRETVSATYQL